MLNFFFLNPNLKELTKEDNIAKQVYNNN
jgi:hypothetical protein